MYKCKARSSSGQDASLSRWNQGFDSPTGHLEREGSVLHAKILLHTMEGIIMLVSAKEMLQKAKAGHYAVGQFNINNLEWTKAILLTAQENNSPVILGVSEGAG